MRDPTSSAPGPGPLPWLLRFVLLGGGILCGYLAWTGVTGDPTAGCLGPSETGCEDVLGSRWSQWGGLPVSIPAASLYFTMLAVSFLIGDWVPDGPARVARMLLLTMAGAALAAAVLFVGIQWIELESTCPLCMTVHVFSAIAFGLALLVVRLPWSASALCLTFGSVLAVGSLVLGQPAREFWGYELELVENRHNIAPFRFQPADSAFVPFDAPQPAVTPAAGGDQATDDQPSEDVADDDGGDQATEQRRGRSQRVLDGLVQFHPAEHPCLYGDDDSPVVVFLFDYNCGHCRRMNGYLRKVADSRENGLRVVLMACPLHPSCNRHVSDEDGIEGSCELALLAYAVWRLEPERFEDYHNWLFSERQPPSTEEARAKAESLVRPSRLRAALKEGAVDGQVAQQAELYGYVGAGVTPKLLLPRAILTGVPDSAAVLRRLLEKELAGPNEARAGDAS